MITSIEVSLTMHLVTYAGYQQEEFLVFTHEESARAAYYSLVRKLMYADDMSVPDRDTVLSKHKFRIPTTNEDVTLGYVYLTGRVTDGRLLIQTSEGWIDAGPASLDWNEEHLGDMLKGVLS